MRRTLNHAAIPAAALAAAQAAAQVVTTAPVGPRVEAVVGYDHSRMEIQGAEDLKGDGVLYGVGVGYDFAVSPSVSASVDLEATDSTAKKTFDDGINRASVSAGQDLYAGGRVSFPVSNVANVYVKGGYTNFQVKGELNGISDRENLDGYRLGAGGQLAVSGRTHVGGEYRYSDYESDVKKHQLAVTVGTRF